MPHTAIVVPTANDDLVETPVLRLAEHAIGLWHAAEAVGDSDFLDALRPLLAHVGRLLAREVTTADIDGLPN